MRKIFLTIILFFAGSVQAAEPSMIVFDLTEGEVLYAHNSDAVRPIASITKLVTAMVALDHYDKTTHALITEMLVTSSNSAAEKLASRYPGGRLRFITAMNTKVKDMGLTETKFTDPSGLSVFNISTAEELVMILYHAVDYDLITNATTTLNLMSHHGSRKQKKSIKMNTNTKLLQRYTNIILGKTGYTSQAGRCLAVLIEKNRSVFAVIALGFPNPKERESVMVNLIDNYARPKQLNIAFKGL